MFALTLQANSIGCQYISRSQNNMSRVRDVKAEGFFGDNFKDFHPSQKPIF
jgi:hypothetical protein